jgi:hypothetical protein
MASDDSPHIEISETGLSAPFPIGSSNSAKAAELRDNFDVPPDERGEVPPQFRGKVFRVMNGELFIVDPGSPPTAPSA